MSMREVKLQIRIEPEMKAEWIERARVRGVTLTSLIMEAMGRSAEELPKKGVGKAKASVMTKGKKELPSQEVEGFRSYFK